MRLKFGRNFLCGGSLIDGETVVTAAHCCYGQAASDFEVYVNDHFIFDSKDGETRTRAKVSRSYMSLLELNRSDMDQNKRKKNRSNDQ